MKKEKEFKTYIEDDIKYRFDDEKMRKHIAEWKKEQSKNGKKLTDAVIREELAEKLSVTADAVRNWQYGYNGPGDLEQVKGIAEYFGISYYELLGKDEKEVDNMSELVQFMEMSAEKQRIITRDRVREIYEATVDCIEKVWEHFRIEEEVYDRHDEDGWAEKTGRAYERAETAYDGLCKLTTKYMLDIPAGLSDKLSEFMCFKLRGVIDNVAILYPAPWEKLEGEDLEAFEKTRGDMLEQAMNYRYEYNKLLREIFGEYIIK